MKKQQTEKTHYNREELREFETLIVEKRNATKELLDSLNEQLKNENNGTDDTAKAFNIEENSNDTLDKESLALMASKQYKFIQGLDQALLRVKAGTYGVCVRTGKLIPRERLMAVPTTMFCIEAKKD